MTTNDVGVAEAKRRLSELMGRVLYRGERFVIKRRGKPMAALVPASDLDRLPPDHERKGLLAALGAWGDDEEIDAFVEGIYRQRELATDRPVEIGP